MHEIVDKVAFLHISISEWIKCFIILNFKNEFIEMSENLFSPEKLKYVHNIFSVLVIFDNYLLYRGLKTIIFRNEFSVEKRFGCTESCLH